MALRLSWTRRDGDIIHRAWRRKDVLECLHEQRTPKQSLLWVFGTISIIGIQEHRQDTIIYRDRSHYEVPHGLQDLPNPSQPGKEGLQCCRD